MVRIPRGRLCIGPFSSFLLPFPLHFRCPLFCCPPLPYPSFSFLAQFLPSRGLIACASYCPSSAFRMEKSVSVDSVKIKDLHLHAAGPGARQRDREQGVGGAAGSKPPAWAAFGSAPREAALPLAAQRRSRQAPGAHQGRQNARLVYLVPQYCLDYVFLVWKCSPSPAAHFYTREK